MRRVTDLVPIAVCCVLGAAVGGCAAREPGARSPDAETVAAPSAPESESSGSASNDLDVNMSFGEDEAEEEDTDAEASRYAPPPTRTYSPSNKVSEADKPSK